jgi:drug/metabolite transporter (DMT)-like permease
VAALLASLFWAIGSAQYSKLTQHHSAFSVNFTRAFIALPFFLVATIIAAGGFGVALEMVRALEFVHLQWAGLSILACYGIGDVAFLVAATYVGLPAALALASTAPVWTVLVSSFVDKTPILIHQGIGLLVTVAGVIVVVLSGRAAPILSDKPIQSNQSKGIALAFFASLCWAYNGYAFAKLSAATNPPLAGLLRMLMALFVTFFLGQFYKNPRQTLLPGPIFWRMAPLIALEAFLGTLLSAYGLANCSLPVGVTLISLAPVVAVPLSVMLGLEKFSMSKTMGVVLVVIGVSFLVGAISFPAYSS